MGQFTPAGLDIYVRNPLVFERAKLRNTIQACQDNVDEGVRGRR